MAQDDVPISTAVGGCGRSFLSLAEMLRKPSRFADQIASDAVLDEFDRFKVWAGNIAAHRKGRSSLDYRLRDAAQLKADTHSLLASLEEALNTAMAIVQGHRLPWDEETFTDSDSDSESSQDGNEHNLQGDTELRQLFARIKSLVTSLMRLSMAIREPAPNHQARSIDKSHFEQHDIWHVQAKFPNAPQYLIERLGRAISSRRQYLTYREVHHDKLKKGIDKLGFEAATTEFTTDSTEATKLQRTDILAIAEDFDDSLSTTSYATSVNATLRAPGLPEEAREQEYYNCPLCFALVSIHTRATWVRHVYQDLHPYCCTVEDCATADRLYDSRHAWFAHESEAHYSKFQCVEGCSKTFEKEQDFETHVKSTHLDFAAAEVYAALKRVSCRAASISELRSCQLCGKVLTLRALQKHLGHHHEQLALFALPANLEETEDERERDDQGSVSRSEERESEEAEMERELSGLSDVSEPDNIAGGSSYTVRLFDPETVPLDTIRGALRRLNQYDEEEIERLAENRSPAAVDYVMQVLLLEYQKERLQSSIARQGQVRTPHDASRPDEDATPSLDAMKQAINRSESKRSITDTNESPILNEAELELHESLSTLSEDMSSGQLTKGAEEKTVAEASRAAELAFGVTKKKTRLGSLQKIISAQKNEQIKREEAAGTAWKAAKQGADAEAKKIAKKIAKTKKSVAEAAELLLNAAGKAREETWKKAAANAEETQKAYKKALVGVKATAGVLEKAKKDDKGGAADTKHSDASKASISDPAQETSSIRSLAVERGEEDIVAGQTAGKKKRIGSKTEA